MKEHMVITIGRQYGTGGHEIGQKVAERLGVRFYDRELIERAAKKTGFDEKLFEQIDRRATNSLLYSLTMFGSVGLNGMSLTDQLYLAQSNLIREFAQDGPCVIVGRCADHVLRDYPNRYDFFIHGSIQSRVHRIESCDGYEIEGKSAESALERMDKQRSTYYHYYTGKRWGECAHYDLGINAGRIGVAGAVEVILSYIGCSRQEK